METEKPCNRCNLVKPLTEYYRDRSRPDGRRVTCIACDKARKRTPEVREQSKRYYHSDKGKAAERRYVASGRKYEVEKVRRAQPEVAAKIKEMSRVYSLAWYHRHKHDPEYIEKHSGPECRAKQREANHRFRERHLEHVRAYTREHMRRKAYHLLPERRVYWQSRRAKKRLLPATFTAKDWRHAVAWFSNCCAYCGSAEKLTQDHVVPLVRGGAYVPSNIVPACKPCNCSKNHTPLESWASAEVVERVRLYLSTLLP